MRYFAERMGWRVLRRIAADQRGLTYPQVFFLVIGFGAASAVIFLFGMWVGRDIAERRLAQEEKVVRAPVPMQPTTLPEEPKQQEVDRAFYERLKDKAVQRLQDTPMPPASAQATPTSTNLVQFGAATFTAIKPYGTPTARPSPRATNTARPRPSVTTATPGDQNDWADAGWTVQVNATTDVAEARTQAQDLRSKGYDAYTVQAPTRGGPTWYRVRVGRFNSREKARARELEMRLRSDEGLPNAYTTPQ